MTHAPIQFKLAPSLEQRGFLTTIYEEQRAIYNDGLATVRAACKPQTSTKAMVEIYDAIKPDLFKALKTRSFIGPFSGPQWALTRLDKTMAPFFARSKEDQNPNWPRFKNGNRWRMFGFLDMTGVKIENNLLRIGDHPGVPICPTIRPLPDTAEFTIWKRDADWLISFKGEGELEEAA